MSELQTNSEIKTKAVEWTRDDYQKRDFASITDATTLILKKINYPLKRRNFICALQGVANGRSEFQAGHQTIARRLGHNGKQTSVEKATYRELKALKKYQAAADLLLFDIEQGGGREHKRTTYFDCLTPVAVWLKNRAAEMKRIDSELKTSPLGKVMESIVEEAVKLLPPFKESRIAAQFQAQDRNRCGEQRRRKEKSRRCLTARENMVKLLDQCLDEYDAKDKDEAENLRQFANLIVSHINDRVEERLSGHTDKNSKMSAMVNSSNSFAHAPLQTEEEGGLPIGSPPSSFEAVKFSPLVLTGTTLRFAQENANLLLEAALDYSRRGWSILPLHTPEAGSGICSCRKGVICKSSGKHPRSFGGVKDATTDQDQIKKWWAKWTGANVGIATGEQSGIVCLDIDPRSGGNETLLKFIEEFGQLPETYTVATGGGGRHFFFRHPGKEIGKLAGTLGSGIDIKSSGGYVVAAPSFHASGGIYRIENALEPVSLPEWLLELLTMKNKDVLRNSAAEDKQSAITDKQFTTALNCSSGRFYFEGRRNKKLFQIGCAMVGRGENEAAVEAELRRTNFSRCSPPLEAEEIERITRNALGYAAPK